MILFLIIIFLCLYWKHFIPESYIPHENRVCRMELPSKRELRYFDICDQEFLDELDEITFTKDPESCNYPFLIKGYTCKIKFISDGDLLDPPLVLFGNNDLDWDSESYLICDSQVIFPEPGSILINNALKKYYGKTIRIVVGQIIK